MRCCISSGSDGLLLLQARRIEDNCVHRWRKHGKTVRASEPCTPKPLNSGTPGMARRCMLL